MPWLRGGTVSVTNGSTAVTGVNTGFDANVRVGDSFIGPDGANYEVANVASATVISILPAYKGPTVSGSAYAIMPVQGYPKLMVDSFNQLRLQFGDKMAALGTTGNYDILPVAKGGTGGGNQADALAGLGLTQAALKNAANVWTQKQTFNTPPVASGPYGGYQISNNNGVQVSSFSMDWANSFTFLDYYYQLNIRDSSQASYPLRMSFSGTGRVSIPGFVQLGEQAPAIKQKLLTGLCAGAAGQASPVAHGLTSSKILGIQALVQTTDSSQWIGPGSDYPGYNFSFIFGATNVNLLNGATNSTNVFNKPYRLLITYQE